ncbi:MAG: serine hydrolase domain-containing protein, partial [Verrucomicrobiota bacterium]
MNRASSPSRVVLAIFSGLLLALSLKAAPAFHSGKLEQMDEAIHSAIAQHQLPGGVLWIEHRGTIHEKVYGNRSLEPVEAMSRDTIFDAASLTKVVATTPAIMLLCERGLLQLDAPASQYLPEFKSEKQAPITIRHLMTHTSGLRPGIGIPRGTDDYHKGIALALVEEPNPAPGTLFRYSDINFILLGEVVRRVSGQTLDQFTAQEIYRPLGMTRTMYLPEAGLHPLIAPTTREADGTLVRGVVHDPTARRMGGVAGHAGLFTTANDLALYSRMLLNRGSLNGKQLFKPETVALMTAVATPPGLPRRGLGWDIDTPYSGPRGKHLPVGSYGHTGWTGTSLWIDPFSESFVIFLCNRNHPTEAGNVITPPRNPNAPANSSLSPAISRR